MPCSWFLSLNTSIMVNEPPPQMLRMIESWFRMFEIIIVMFVIIILILLIRMMVFQTHTMPPHFRKSTGQFQVLLRARKVAHPWLGADPMPPSSPPAALGHGLALPPLGWERP